MRRFQSRDLLNGFLLAAIAAFVIQAQQTTKKSYEFRGKVEKVDAGANLVTVAHGNIPGWMGPMTMGFAVSVDDRGILKQLKPGDAIVATVYEGDLTLYRVKLDTGGAATSDLPPLSYVCRTPGEEMDVSDAPGRCQKSGAPLEPARITRIYTCITHPEQIQREQPGICPLDRKELGPVDVELYFTCRGGSARYLDPGQCPDGKPRDKIWIPRPHGDHNPRHGGSTIFMTSDGRDHVEGTFVAPGVFRVYFYDLMTRPTPPAKAAASVRLTDSSTSRELGPSIPLAHVASSPLNTLEAAVPGAKMPFQIKMRVIFRPGEKEHAFDFSFPVYSKEP